MKKAYFIISFVFLHFAAFSQVKDLSFFIEAQAGYTSNKTVPFWLRSNQFGSVPLQGASGSFIAGGRKDYDTARKHHLLDWGASVEGRVNLGQRSQFILIEGYGKLRIGVFELKAGRVKEMMGLVDTSLSTGAFSVSGNALGIPKVQIGIPEYSNIFGGKLFAFKGNFSHGWLGDMPISTTPHHMTTYFHQSSLYLRVGDPTWKLKLYAGINHQVYWSNEKTSENGLKPGFQTFLYAVTGKTYKHFSKVGNHLGSVDLGLEYDLEKIKLSAYRQSFYDEGALSKLANIKDGLNGISILNKTQSGKTFKWHKFLFEILNTRNQAGYPWSRVTKSGDENYYNNYLYTEGWSYKQMNVGSPFLTSLSTVGRKLSKDSSEYFINNRVLAFHVGMEASVGKVNIKSKFSYSRNYGTFGTSIYGHSRGSLRYPPTSLFKQVGEFSSYLEGNRELSSGLNVGVVAAFDYGGLLDNSVGVFFKVSKSL